MLNILDYHNPQPVSGALNIWQHQLDRNPELVRSMLRHRAGMSARYNARSLKLVTPSAKEAVTFLERNHLNGSAGSTFRYGLSDGEKLLMLITLGKPRYTKSFSLEVLRLASEQGCVVVGGASRLFSYVAKMHNGEAILSYSDALLGDGDVYSRAGFEFLGQTQPGYFWEKGGQVLQRHQTMKHKLVKLLGPDIDVSLSERALMLQAGWWLVRDLGHLRWGLGAGSSSKEKNFNFTYKITRPEIDDSFYLGAHSTNNLNDGYLGSGQRIVSSHQKYGKDAHKREIIEYFATRKELMKAEEKLVTAETVADARCLNISLGGGSPLIPGGSTQGRISVWHETGQERKVEAEELEVFLARGWQIGRHPSNKIHLHGKWYKREDGTLGRTAGEIPEGCFSWKTPTTAGRKWVVRNGKQLLVSAILEGDAPAFRPSRTTKGGTVLEKDGVRRVLIEGVEEAKENGWKKPVPPTQGKIGMRSPTGEKKLVSPLNARQLAKLGWTIATKQLKSAPPQVLELAAELGLKLPKKRDDGSPACKNG
jgi:hypothetical protein